VDFFAVVFEGHGLKGVFGAAAFVSDTGGEKLRQ
jgi:hypothetical protein